MSWLHGASARLRLLLARRASEARIDREIALHVELETERLVATGLDPDEARRRAFVAFGGVEKHREELRQGRGTGWISGLSLDLKLGLRMLAKHPGLTLVGVLGLSTAVAIGAIAFSAVATLTVTALPFDEGDRVVMIQNLDTRNTGEERKTHLHDLAVWRAELNTVVELGAFRTVDRNLISAGAPARGVRVVEMSANGFKVARVAPLIGRYLTEADERPGAPPVVVIGYEIWQSRFAGRVDAVGSTVQLGATTHTIVGVMPEGFLFPVNNKLWAPLTLNPALFPRGDAPPIDVFGRLAPGATLAQAQRQLATIGQRLSAAYPETHDRMRPRVLPYTRSFLDTPSLAWALHLVQIVISLLLVVIGTNVAVLIYARTASRAGELAVRTALGASRGRIVMQLFAEALVLSTVASAVGILTAHFVFGVVEALVRQSAQDQIPFWMHLRVSPGVVVYVAGLAILAAVIIGVIPGLKATRAGVHANLKELSGSSIRLGRTWTVLLVSQVAVSVAALPLALQGINLWVRLGALDPGLASPAAVLVASPRLELDALPTKTEAQKRRSERYLGRVEELARRVEAEPGVAGVAFSKDTPGTELDEPLEVEAAAGARREARSGDIVTRLGHVDAGYFPFYGVKMLAGRNFTAADLAPGATAVLVNQAFVDRFVGGSNPLGRRVRTSALERGRPGDREAGPWWEVVGVVPNVPATVMASAAVPTAYRPLRMSEMQPVVMAVRVAGGSMDAMADRIRELAAQVDPVLRFDAIRTLDAVLDDHVKVNRLALLGLWTVTSSVVLLTAAGIYALMSFTISRRRREIGIRAALGAGQWRVLASVLSRAMRQIGLGIAIGIAGVGALGLVIAHDQPIWKLLWILVQIAATMTVVGLLATISPARRALRIQPTECLKAE